MTATARRNHYRKIANRARRIPGAHGLRPYQVYVVTRVEGGTYTGDNPGSATTTEILESGYPPKVRMLNGEELALGGLAKGTIEVGPVTPVYPGGGMALADATGSALSAGDVLWLRVDWVDGTQYYRVSDRLFDRGIHWTFRGEPVSVSDG